MTIEEKYQERLTRINKAIRFEPVDQIPLIYLGTGVATRQMGITMAEFVNNPIKGIDAHLDYMDQLGVDGANAPAWFRADAALSPAWLSRVKMPGRDLDDDVMWQVAETEDMTVEDYDIIINQGFEAFLPKILPKIIDMQVFSEGIAKMQEILPIQFQKYRERGYVLVSSGTTTIPFETLCGGRSMMPFFMDLYRIPEKVEEAMDVMTQMHIDMAIGIAEQTGIRCVWVGGWRSASPPPQGRCPPPETPGGRAGHRRRWLAGCRSRGYVR